MGLWFRPGHGTYDKRSDNLKAREQYWETRQQDSEDIVIDENFDYSLSFEDNVELGNISPDSISFLDVLSNISTILLIIYIIDKYFVKKNYKISSSECFFMFYFLIKTTFPIVSLITLCVQIPATIKILKNWLPKNVNKRKELEAQLRLLTQY